jgi:eukaryotic-like serine/threonine-protein kinase
MKPPIDDEIPAIAETVEAGPTPEVAAEPERPALRVVGGRYEILGLVGSGGMGTVYRARDRELDEIVALKMLKKRLSASGAALDRFKREVKLARRVTHRNVARTFDIAEHADGKFLTMEFIDGEMLRSQLARSGTLPVADVVRIGRDVCAGLSAAHAAGVLHRDLKPENIILARDRRAVITDFGIARALSYSEAAKSAGEVVGTPAYMAPEQLENAELDERSDVYALGVVLFELLTGDVPWAHESPIKAAIARMREPPPDVRATRSSVPEAMALVVAKCMATKRDDRYATADEVSEALGYVVAPPVSSSSIAPSSYRRSSSRMAVARARAAVAVLPLVVEQPQIAHYAGAITDALVELLGASPDLLVVHAPSASLDPRATGRALNVHAVVSGTFQLIAARIEVTLRVVTVEDGFEIWSQTIGKVAAEFDKIAGEAAPGIAAALSTRVTTFPRSMPTDRVAYDLYLRGRAVFLRGWYAAAEAVRLFGEAAARSPDNATIAAAHARALARAYGGENTGDPRDAQAAAERAIVLDPTRAEARIALAMVYLYRCDGVGAATELSRALGNASPTDPDVLELLGRLRAEVGPPAMAIEHLELVLAREPNFMEARNTLARLHALQRDWSKVAGALGPEPSEPSQRVPFLLMEARLLMWRQDEAARERAAARLEEIADLELRLRVRQMFDLVLGVAVRGALVPDDQMRLADNFPTDTATNQRRASFNAQIRAEVLGAANARDLALEAITEADANGLLDLVWLENCPVLDTLRDSPVYQGARRRTGMRAARVRDVLDGR